MIKRMVFLKRKQGVTPEEFREQYEEVHVPLALEFLTTVRKYVRNYITTNTSLASTAEPGFDCITEQWFDDMEGYQAMVNSIDGDAGQALIHSLKVFVDLTKAVEFLVEEVESEIT
ncbi:EthD domain-containing protein [Chloroflexota bacterium]